MHPVSNMAGKSPVSIRIEAVFLGPGEILELFLGDWNGGKLQETVSSFTWGWVKTLYPW